MPVIKAHNKGGGKLLCHLRRQLVFHLINRRLPLLQPAVQPVRIAVVGGKQDGTLLKRAKGNGSAPFQLPARTHSQDVFIILWLQAIARADNPRVILRQLLPRPDILHRKNRTPEHNAALLLAADAIGNLSQRGLRRPHVPHHITVLPGCHRKGGVRILNLTADAEMLLYDRRPQRHRGHRT